MKTNTKSPNVTWHDMPNGYAVQVIHKPGHQMVQIIDDENSPVCELPYETPASAFAPICAALWYTYMLGFRDGRNA